MNTRTALATGVLVASCAALTACWVRETEVCLSHADCMACERCVNGSCQEQADLLNSCGLCGPESLCSADAGAPDAEQLDIEQPDTAQPDTAQPDSGGQDQERPDTSEPADAGVDAGEGDAAAPDAASPDGAIRPPDCGASGDCPIDLLLVIDNSGSMAEEQDVLAEAIPTLIGELELRRNHYHVGVITTDMRDCDNPYGSGIQRGSVLQRGCLQTGLEDPTRTVVDWQAPDAVARLQEIIRNVDIYGSSYEKGLEAAQHFLTPGHSVPEPNACAVMRDCSGDLDSFLRSTEVNAAGETVDVMLQIVFVTDEDDCSHGGSIDELVSGNTDLCYTDPGRLTPTASFASFFEGLKPTPELVSVSAIAGLFDAGSGLQPSGCKGSPVLTDVCDPAFGNSVATCTICVNEEPVCPCHPELTCPGGAHFPATNCCQADPAQRYYEVASLAGTNGLESLCELDYSNFFSMWAVSATGTVVGRCDDHECLGQGDLLCDRDPQSATFNTCVPPDVATNTCGAPGMRTGNGPILLMSDPQQQIVEVLSEGDDPGSCIASGNRLVAFALDAAGGALSANTYVDTYYTYVDNWSWGPTYFVESTTGLLFIYMCFTSSGLKELAFYHDGQDGQSNRVCVAFELQ